MGTGQPDRSILLVGMMGSGKSAVGRALADRLGWELVDSDHAVEQRAGATIPEIFRGQGEDHFRRLERGVLEALPRERTVVALGGGAVASALNREILARKGIQVWLDAPPETLASRIGASRERPLLGDRSGPERVARLAGLLRERREAYAEAPIRVCTAERSVGEVASAILKRLSEQEGPQ